MRRFFPLFSIAAHAIAIVVVLVAQIFAVGPLPNPQQPMVFQPLRVMPIEIPLKRTPRRAPEGTPAVASRGPAPAEEPKEISADSLRTETAGPFRGPSGVPGVDGGVDSLTSVGNPITHVPLTPRPSPAREQSPVRLHAGMERPQKILHVSPAYPPVAQQARVQGVVILDAIIDTSGAVRSLQVLRSIPLLDRAASDAVRQWRFTPARLNGVAVPVVMTVTVQFSLER
jgi:periplasmic protein TonB